MAKVGLLENEPTVLLGMAHCRQFCNAIANGVSLVWALVHGWFGELAVSPVWHISRYATGILIVLILFRGGMVWWYYKWYLIV